MTAPADSSGTWRELFGRRHGGTAVVLAGGVAIYATNEFITMSLLPSMVADIGGVRLYAWVTSVYLVASVAGAAGVGPVLSRFGPRASYLAALLTFAAGTAVCAAAPSMAVLLSGRAIQGAAGGVLAGLGYAVISATLPSRLWTRASATVSAMWGVGTLLGPAAGGIFAQFGWWRAGFVSLLALAVLMAAVVPAALPVRAGRPPERIAVPVGSLLLLSASALAVSVAALPRSGWATPALLAFALALMVLFVWVDRHAAAKVLPRNVFGPGPLKWIYAVLGLLMAATMVDMYVPLFAQRLAGLTPVVAGFLGAALSVGWTVAEIRSASLAGPRATARVVAVAPLVMACGLALAALTQPEAPAPVAVAAWAAALVLAGAGIGMAWPHLSVWAMAGADGAAQQAVAGAAITTVQLICGAFGAGLAGVLTNVRPTPDAAVARTAFAVFAALAVAALIGTVRVARRPRG